MTTPAKVTVGDVIEAIGESLRARKRREKLSGNRDAYYSAEYSVAQIDERTEHTLKTYIDQRIAARETK